MMGVVGLRRSNLYRDRAQYSIRAQVIVEYAIVFPILLMITLVIIQLAHIFVAAQVINYAAFAAARAEIVGEDPDAAAALVCSRIAGTGGVGTGSTVYLPGWGDLPRSLAAEIKTDTFLVTDEPFQQEHPDAVTIEVTHDFELRVPVADMMVYRLGDVFLVADLMDMRTYGTPHIYMKSRSTLAKPWSD